MSAKQKRIPHVPENGAVINSPSPGRGSDRIPSSKATKPVTLASLASDIEGIKDQVAIMVEWLQTLDERTASDD